MARVTFVKKAQKDIPDTDIKAGDSYYWWKFRFGGKHTSKTPPKRSQLTQSNFLSQLYELEDRLSEFTCSSKDDFDSFKGEMVADIESVRDECQDSLDNMPDQLQSAPTGELLQERIDGMDSWIADIENVECDYDEEDTRSEIKEENEQEEGESEEDYNERIEALVTEKEEEVVNDAVSELQETSSGL